jgi:hypothetical protein
MVGDLLSPGFGAVRFLSSSESSIRSFSHSSAAVRTPLASYAGVKITENESPRPMDRVFATFNYFNGVDSFAAGRGSVYHGLVGFEKTFLDGNASFGMRLPFNQGDGAAVGVDGFGDITLISKYAFYNDTDTGDLLSAGLAITAPTGVSPTLLGGTRLNSVLLQPYGGFIYNAEDLFLQGFTAIIIPTESRDVTLWSLDLGVGYWLYRSNDEDRILTGLVPTIEAHVNTPFSNNGPGALIYAPTSVFITPGLHFRMFDNAWFTLAAAIPVSGPVLYDAEFIAQLNIRF